MDRAAWFTIGVAVGVGAVVGFLVRETRSIYREPEPEAEVLPMRTFPEGGSLWSAYKDSN